MVEIIALSKGIDEDLNIIDLEELSNAKSVKEYLDYNNNNFKNSFITIINSKCYGRIILFSKEFMKNLNNSETLNISIIDNTLLISGKIVNAEFCFPAKDTIFSSELVDEITEKLNLKFDNTIYETFNNITFKESDDIIIAKAKK